MGGGREDGACIVVEDLEPVTKIGRVILADVGRDAKVGAEEGGTQFCDQLFAGIARVAETLAAEITVETCFVTSPVSLMPISA